LASNIRQDVQDVLLAPSAFLPKLFQRVFRAFPVSHGWNKSILCQTQGSDDSNRVVE
jgi:hypothetical protein